MKAYLTEREIAEINDLLSVQVMPWWLRLPEIYPAQFSHAFSEYHAEFWDFIDQIELGVPSPAFIACWPREAGKSTGAETAVIELGANRQRRYCWYVRSTQDQADKSVENIQAALETPHVRLYYPEMSEAAVSRIGRPKAWRRNRLITASGFILDGMGLDKAVRGVKSEEQRPDLIIFDDIDERHDTAAATKKKIETLTESILPAGASQNAIILYIQNKIIPDGVMAQLTDGRADFLLDRIVSGPHPAAYDLQVERRDDYTYKVVGGEPTWEDGQGLETIERQINLWGLTAFLREAQHEVELSGGMYDEIEFRYCSWDELPDFIRIALWVDPAVTSTDGSDSMGIQADGLAADDTIYRLFSWEAITSPRDAIKRAIRKAIELGAESVGIETDQGGDTWYDTYENALEDILEEIEQELAIRYPDDQEARDEAKEQILLPAFKQDKAGAGKGSKVHRGMQMLADYEKGRIIHVIGTSAALEKALKRFPLKPLDLADAAWWSWQDLRGDQWLFTGE